jgi:hypothetical protein
MKQYGKLDYLGLPAANLAESKRFYSEAFGWTFTDYGPTYASFEQGLDGGINAEDPSGAPVPVLYAHDLEAMEAKMTAAGGQITRPIFSFPGGRRFHFRDPAGTELAVWSSSE